MWKKTGFQPVGLLLTVCIFVYSGQTWAGQTISCHVTYTTRDSKGAQLATPGPDIEADVKSDGSAYRFVRDEKRDINYVIGQRNGEGAIAVKVSNDALMMQATGDFSKGLMFGYASKTSKPWFVAGISG